MEQTNDCVVSIDPATFVMIAVMVLLFPVTWVCAWVGAVFVHEMGHYFTVRLWQKRVYAICIHPQGVKMQTEVLPPLTQVCCSLAGPLAGLCLLPLRSVYPHIALCALLQSTYNLLPVSGLDGAVALRTVLEVLLGSTTALCVCNAVEFIFWLLCVIFAIKLTVLGLGWTPILILIIFTIRNKKIKFSCKQ